MIVPSTSQSPFRSTLGIAKDQCVVLYSGNMGEKQGLEIVVDAARRVPDLVFVMCGDGAARGRLEERAQGLENMKWLPLQPLERLNDLLNLADIHVLPQRAGADGLVMPSKLTGILASGRPVVVTAARNSHLADIVSECGIVTDPEDTDALVGALLQLQASPAQRFELGKTARRLAEAAYAKDSVLAGFEGLLHQIIN